MAGSIQWASPPGAKILGRVGLMAVQPAGTVLLAKRQWPKEALASKANSRAPTFFGTGVDEGALGGMMV
jgi:hypothetical protein